MTLFQRFAGNPILTPTPNWWESRAVLNPGAVVYRGRVALPYRALGFDGISRLGLAWLDEGQQVVDREPLPWFEAALDDPMGRLGVEDPRVTALDGDFYLTYCKVSVSKASVPPLGWEPAPFRMTAALALTSDFERVLEISTPFGDLNLKDVVLFPAHVGEGYAALIRDYPSIRHVTSADLVNWSEPRAVLEPRPGTWEGERVGAGPPPMLTPWGWLLLYHGNEFVESHNRRRYCMGLAVLDLEDPARVLYRHPDPVLEPEADYEVRGPVGNVVFGTGLVELGTRLWLYYGAGDGVIGAASVEKDELFDLLEGALGKRME